MAETPRLTYQVLTKRSTRWLRLAPELPWPPNLWMGVSVENQDYVIRAAHLVKVPAAVRFLSVEIMLGQVDLASVRGGLHSVIAGGDRGPSARPCEPDWLRERLAPFDAGRTVEDPPSVIVFRGRCQGVVHPDALRATGQSQEANPSVTRSRRQHNPSNE